MAKNYISPNTIEEMAANILADFPDAVENDGICEVDIVVIAEGLGCSVEEVDFTPNTVVAQVERKNGAYTIQVARRDGPRRKRFSIAHEVSHIILHDDNKSKFVERRQPLVDYSETELYKEVQANMLAAAMLMPKEKTIKMWRSTRSVEEVAEIFNVSLDAATNRLSNLGLLNNE